DLEEKLKRQLKIMEGFVNEEPILEIDLPSYVEDKVTEFVVERVESEDPSSFSDVLMDEEVAHIEIEAKGAEVVEVKEESFVEVDRSEEEVSHFDVEDAEIEVVMVEEGLGEEMHMMVEAAEIEEGVPDVWMVEDESLRASTFSKGVAMIRKWVPDPGDKKGQEPRQPDEAEKEPKRCMHGLKDGYELVCEVAHGGARRHTRRWSIGIRHSGARKGAFKKDAHTRIGSYHPILEKYTLTYMTHSDSPYAHMYTFLHERMINPARAQAHILLQGTQSGMAYTFDYQQLTSYLTTHKTSTGRSVYFHRTPTISPTRWTRDTKFQSPIRNSQFAHLRNSQIRHMDSLTTLFNQKSSIKDLHTFSGTWRAIKAQVLADFIQEGTKVEEELGAEWQLFVDGSVAKSGARLGIVLVSPKGDYLEFAAKVGFRISNNEVGYEAVIKGLSLAKAGGARRVQVHSNSQLVVGQFQEGFEVKEDRMRKYIDEMRKLKEEFDSFELIQIPRGENGRADLLSKIAQSLVDCRSSSVTLLLLEKSAVEAEVAEIEE
ncbi:Unknown protein, partial [Striga hermonthica]